MARIRTIKPEFWTDSFMVQLEPLARLVYVALWTAADDHGYINDEPDRLAMELMPREDPLVIDATIQLFWASGRLERFDADGRTYYRVSKWTEHQRPSHPAASKIVRESSRKLAIPQAVRRAVAEKYGCPPGGRVEAECYYCGATGQVYWHRLYDGRPSGWVSFPGLELDHFVAEHNNGTSEAENFVLACRPCNRGKQVSDPLVFAAKRLAPELAGVLANPPEDARLNRDQGKEQGKESSSSEDASNSEAVDNSTDDDAYQQVIGLIVDAKEREWGVRIDKPRAWRHKVHMNTHLEDGAQIRSELALGNDPEHVALTILGYGHSAAQERLETAWCESDCVHGCEGDGWTRTDEGFVPCPGRG